MIHSNVPKSILVTAMTLVGLAVMLSGWMPPASQNSRAQAASPVAAAAMSATTGPSITLSPSAGPATAAVTAQGVGWQAGDEMLVSVEDQGQFYQVAHTTVRGEGDFSVSFFVPDFWKNHTTITVVAQAVGGPQASTSYTITDVPTPVTTTQPQAPQGQVNVTALNVRSGPGVDYSIVGQLRLDEMVSLTGQNNGWWQIQFPNPTGAYGWVAGQFIDATNVENIPVQIAPPPPPPTPTPPTPAPSSGSTAAFQCNPDQWSGCGDSCLAQRMSQCSHDGQYRYCVENSASCIPPETFQYETYNYFHRPHHRDN